MALIVEDEPNTLPDVVHNAEDVLLFVQHFETDTLEGIARQSGDGKLRVTLNDDTDTFGTNYRLVNGQLQPTLSIQPGQWQRWVSKNKK